jgi:hypothetical protein
VKNVENLVIADIDADQYRNEVKEAGIKIFGYPTLLFWTANDKSKSTEYEGERTTEKLKKFLKGNSKSY